MLQIVQGMYFRQVPLTNNTHRGVFFTNLRALGNREPYVLMFGRVMPSTVDSRVGTLTIEVTERLETLTLAGTMEVLHATDGTQLLDEVAAVIAFCLNAVCVRDHDMARRLIADSSQSHHSRGPSSILRQTFDARIFLNDALFEDVDSFSKSLTALNRPNYKAAMRAIRQVVDATLMVAEDATLAYTLLVASLESLAQSHEPGNASWSEYDQRKRARIDAATSDLTLQQKERIQSAVLANEHGAIQRRFVAFVLSHIEPSFFRQDAVDAVRPIKSTDLPLALQKAYEIRSRNVHTLENLAPEVWMATFRADTANVDDSVLLSLEGLARLARHVIRRYVERAPKGDHKDFQYRSELPGIVRARWSPELWIANGAGLDRTTAPEYFNGVVTVLIELLSGRTKQAPDLTDLASKIKRIAPSLANREDRLPMTGIFILWNHFLHPDHKFSIKAAHRDQWEKDLAAATMIGFVVNLLRPNEHVWSLESLRRLSAERIASRRTRRFQPLPDRIDAALHLVVADRLLEQGDRINGLSELSHAIEAAPGLTGLMDLEASVHRGEELHLDITRFVLGEADFFPLSNAKEL
ncbi:hypothetical protein [Stenotrophomonas maltophilia]|uniref:hypothetical protein n=1 Tax=Stenotrophomonas maltophilia TaxID=40324 RepID=UPI00051910E7|nr:hypothetical protein [Stenotrophomonas maltophilia]QGL77846.1 hypothetical protein FEO95_20265 [Stenotrophomonas maltophilia]